MGRYLLHPTGMSLLQHHSWLQYHNHHLIDFSKQPYFPPVPRREGRNNNNQSYGFQVQGYSNFLLYQYFQITPYLLLQMKLGRFPNFLSWIIFWPPFFPSLLLTHFISLLSFIPFLWSIFTILLPLLTSIWRLPPVLSQNVWIYIRFPSPSCYTRSNQHNVVLLIFIFMSQWSFGSS